MSDEIPIHEQYKNQDGYLRAEMLERIAIPHYQFLIPRLKESTWRTALSSVDTIRHGLEARGRGTVPFAFFKAFENAHGSLKDGCQEGLYGILEKAVMSDAILNAIMRKISHDGIQVVIPQGREIKRRVFHRFVGAMCADVKDPDQLTSCLISIFTPLVEVGMRARNEYQASLSQSSVGNPLKKKRRCYSKYSGDGMSRPMANDLKVLTAIYDLEQKTKSQHRESSPAVDWEDREIYGSEDEEDEEEAERDVDDEPVITPWAEYSLSSKACDHAGSISSSFAATGPFWAAPKPLGGLLQSEPVLVAACSTASPVPVASFLRSPLTPRNHQDLSPRQPLDNWTLHPSTLFSGDLPLGWGGTDGHLSFSPVALWADENEAFGFGPSGDVSTAQNDLAPPVKLPTARGIEPPRHSRKRARSFENHVSPPLFA